MVYHDKRTYQQRREYILNHIKKPHVKKYRLEQSRTPKNRLRQKLYMRKWRKINRDREDSYRLRAYLKYGGSAHRYGHALRSWSRTVRSRDNNKCQICGSEKGVVSHHIFYKSLYPKLSLNINNGVTLCVLHHKEVHLGDWFSP